MAFMGTHKQTRARKPRDPHPLIVRMMHTTYQELEQDAKSNVRSVNNHVLWLIEERLRKVRVDGH